MMERIVKVNKDKGEGAECVPGCGRRDCEGM
jgi:hypothetical protein